jgi:hypothetical protein
MKYEMLEDFIQEEPCFNQTGCWGLLLKIRRELFFPREPEVVEELP